MLIPIALSSALAAAPGEILRDIEHLRVTGSVLYVAAHPDDENTSLIAWLEGERGIRTAYLSMTRGGGGQNLIGSEQADLLGVVRTGELLAARRIDGAEQRFTRMIDFGYSKSSDETLAFWNHDDAVDDVVRAIREFRPDAIVTRFPTTGETHGHHLASAILAKEAFGLAADPSYVTEGLAPWAADRLLHNQSSWAIDENTDTSGWAKLDVGTYDPRTGLSYGEVAAASRTMHKSQGFGSEPEIGPDVEYFVPTLGTAPAAGGDPLAGLDLGLSRFEGTKALDKALRIAAEKFDPEAPWDVLPRLAKAHALLDTIPDEGWRALETAALEEVMADCVGLWLLARADAPAVAPGGTVKITLTAASRAPADVVLHRVALTGGTEVAGAPLSENAPWTAETPLTVAADAAFTRPHWLVEPATRAANPIADPALRNLADTPASLQADFDLTIGGVRMTVRRPVDFAWTDSVAGERSHALEILPPVTATFDHPGQILPAAGSTTRITLRARTGAAEGVLRLSVPEGITAVPSEVPFALDAGGERAIEVRLSSVPGASRGPLSATVEVGGAVSGLQEAVIDHPHLPRRTVLSPAVQQLVPVDVARGPTTLVGYVVGSGDAVPDGLRAAGYTVEELDEAALVSGNLARFDAIVMGIRAYNTRPRLLGLHKPLMAYVAAGGRLIVQYNTNNRFDPLAGEIGPLPFHISRGRVTDETAEMVPTNPSHPALLKPNALGPADFDGWVQERGLYFADGWDPGYETVFAAHDPGEEPLEGSTLVAHHGEGVFVYTGLSFFRQLPAGVPGAYRLLANLLALE